MLNTFNNLEKTFSQIKLLYDNTTSNEVSNTTANFSNINRYKYLINDIQQFLQNVTTLQNSLLKCKNFTNLNNTLSTLKKQVQLLKFPTRKNDQPTPFMEKKYMDVSVLKNLNIIS